MKQHELPVLPEPCGTTWQYNQYGHGVNEPNGCFTLAQVQDIQAEAFEAGKLAAAIRAGSCVPNLSDEDLNSRWRDPDNAGLTATQEPRT